MTSETPEEDRFIYDETSGYPKVYTPEEAERELGIAPLPESEDEDDD